MSNKDDITQALRIYPSIKYFNDNFITKTELRESTNKILTAIDRIYRVVKKIESRITKLETALA